MPLLPALPGRRDREARPSRADFLAHLADVLASSRRRTPRRGREFPLRVESLEPRMTPATFSVDSFSDEVDANPGNGVIDQAGGVTSLRAAIMEAVALGGSHTLELYAGNYVLDLDGPAFDDAWGDLDVSGSVNITIRGSTTGPTVIEQTVLDRVFEVTGGASLTLENVTVRGGRTDSLEGGGGVRVVESTLTVRNSAIVNNAATNSFGASGGGIHFTSGSGAGRMTIVNSTIADNTATGSGAGISTYHRTANRVVIDHATIVYNSGVGTAGVYNVASGVSIVLRNSIVWANSAGDGGPVDVGGTYGSGSTRNVVGVLDSYAPGFSTSNNRVGPSYNPQLGSRATHGGTTLVYEIGPGGGAIDYASSSFSQDQRYFSRPQDGDGNGSAVRDSGAFEAAALPPQTVTGYANGYIWYDLDADGVRDGGEPAAANVTMRLYWSTGDLIKQVTTDANGYYYLAVENEPRPTSTAVLYIVGVKPGASFFWTFKDQGDDDFDSDLGSSNGRSDAFLFNLSGGGGPYIDSLAFPEPDPPPSPVSFVSIDGGLIFSNVSSSRDDDFEIPDPEIPGPDLPDPYDFFYKVPFNIPTPERDSFAINPVRLEDPDLRVGEYTPRGEQAYLNVYKVVEVGRRRLTERIAMMSIDEADPNVAQGILGAAAPGRYRITVQDRLGEELVWEGDLPFDYAAAQTGVQKTWKTVRDRIDVLRDRRDAPREDAPPVNAEKPEKPIENPTSQGAWSEQVERLATLLTGLDLPGDRPALLVR